MAGHLQLCCRLCLSEKQDDLRSVFDETASNSNLRERILQHISIEVSLDDKVTTMVCTICTQKLDNWSNFRQDCLKNQLKLEQFVDKSATTNFCETVLQIKEEPMDQTEEDSGVEMVKGTPGNSTATLIDIKSEIIDVGEEATALFAPHFLEEDNSYSQNTNDVDKKKCSVCTKTFSTVGNRRKHERQFHSLDVGRRTILNQEGSSGSPYISVSEKPQEPQNDTTTSSQDEENTSVAVNDTENSPKFETDPEQQKILFAAGLKLLQKNATPIEFEDISKIELSYIEKCKAMATMYQSLECACHQVKHPNLKGLLSHLRALRIWFPVFTCYNCMISFTDRSTFQKHYKVCPREPLDAIKRLSNLRKRSEVKVRLYQNYKCTSCRFLFSFHDEFCKHIDEEHLEGGAPYRCTCTGVFEDTEAYKDHVYVSCRVEYYCDICFVTTKTLDDFQKHAQECHDSSEGFLLLQDDNYSKRKPMPSPTVKVDKESETQSLVLTGKRERKQSTRMPVLFVETEPETTKPSKYLSTTTIFRSRPTVCPTCKKEYTTFNNMLRHFKGSHLEQIENGTLPPPTEDDLEDNEEESYYSCPDCGGVFKSDEWLQHIDENHQPQTCKKCGKMFQFETELKEHLKKCDVLSPRASMNSNSGGVMVMCEICDEMFMSKEELRVHKLLHEDDDPGEVPLLQPDLNSKEENEDSSDDNIKYYCEPCDKGYPSYSGWWSHNKRMHNQKPPSEFPKKCDYCDEVFDTGSSFFRHKQSHEKLTLNDLRPGTTAPSAAAKVQKKLMEIPVKEEDESYHACKRCFKVFSTRYNLKMHMKSHGITSDKSSSKKPVKKHICEECDIEFDSNEYLINHKMTEHNNANGIIDNLSDAVDIDVSKPVIYTCDLCTTTCSSKQAMKKHKERHMLKDIQQKTSNTSVYCKYCKIAFVNVNELTKHMHLEHNETAKPKITKSEFEKPHRCRICRKGFATVGALNAHAGWHKRGKAVETNGVEGKFVKHSKMIKKLATIPAKVPTPRIKSEFQCTSCLAELPNDTALQIHILEKHRSVNAIMLIPRCNTCNQDFSTQEEYEKHKRFHDFLERQKKHEVQKIQQESKLLQAFKAPLKRFPCKYCPAAFRQVDTLKAHINMNHPETLATSSSSSSADQTEFKCTQCDRVFDKAHSLSIHLKIHEKLNQAGLGQKMMNCSICNLTFRSAKELRQHTIRDHPF